MGWTDKLKRIAASEVRGWQLIAADLLEENGRCIVAEELRGIVWDDQLDVWKMHIEHMMPFRLEYGDDSPQNDWNRVAR